MLVVCVGGVCWWCCVAVLSRCVGGVCWWCVLVVLSR